jgi:hypothetical protein
MMDVSGILGMLTGQAAAANNQIDAVTQQLTNNTAEMQQLMDANLQDAGAMIGAGVNIANQKAEIAYNTAKTQEQAQAVAGLSREDQSNQYIQSMAELTAAQQERKQVKAKMDALTEVSFFDSPIGYILNRMELPAVAAKYNNLIDRETAAAENIATRTNMLKQFNTTTIAANADAQRQVDLQAAQLLQHQATSQMREQRIKNMSQLGQQALQTANLADKKFDNLAKIANTQISMEQFAEMRAERAEARALRREEMNARLADKKTKEEAKSQIDGNIANVSAILGVVDANGEPLIKDVATLETAVKDTKKRDMWKNAAFTGTIGSDLRESVMFFRDNANRTYLGSNNAMLLRAGDGFYQGLLSTANSMNVMDPKTGKLPSQKDIAAQAPEQYEAKLVGSAALRAGQTKTLTDKEFDSVFNPYRAPHALMLENIKKGNIVGLEGNVLVDALSTVAAAKTNGGNMTGADEQEAFKVVGELVKQRKIDPKIAAVQIANYYKTAASVADRAYGTTAIFNLPKQTSYAATVEIPGQVYGTNPMQVDLMNPANVERALAQYVVKTATNIGQARRDSFFLN